MENPYFSPDLAHALVDRPKQVVLAGHEVVLEAPVHPAQLELAGSVPLAVGPITFALRDGAHVPPCPDGEVHMLDGALVLVGAHGSVGPNDLLRDAHYVLVLTAEQVTRVSRRMEQRLRRSARSCQMEVWASATLAGPELVITLPELRGAEIARTTAALEDLLASAGGHRREWQQWSDGWDRLD